MDLAEWNRSGNAYILSTTAARVDCPQCCRAIDVLHRDRIAAALESLVAIAGELAQLRHTGPANAGEAFDLEAVMAAVDQCTCKWGSCAQHRPEKDPA
jgi:hypothetical protein